MHRIFLRRDEVVKMCEMNKVEKFRRFAYIHYEFTAVGAGNWGDSGKVFEVRSKKTGNTSRLVDAYPVEIEGISPCFYLFYSDEQFRKSEILVNQKTGKTCNLTPIGRDRVAGNVIYAVEEV